MNWCFRLFFIDVSEIRRYPSIKPEFVSSSATIYEALGCLIVLSFGTSRNPGFRFIIMKSLHSKQRDFGNWKKFSQKKKQSSKPKSWNIMSIKQIDRKFCLKNATTAEERGYVGKQFFQVLRPFQGHNFCGVQTLQVQFSYIIICHLYCRNKNDHETVWNLYSRS